MHIERIHPPSFASRPTIRPLSANDSSAYRALRRRIRDMGDGKYFSDSYTREDKFTSDSEWQAWCTEAQDHCTIGTFIGEELVGIMGIVMYGKPEDLTVEWEATWLDPRYRRIGIAKLAYEEVRRWTISRGYKNAVVFIRHDNVRSREIRESQGAVYAYTKPNEIWADGSIADADAFTLNLSSTASAQSSSYTNAFHNMTKIFSALNQKAACMNDTKTNVILFNQPLKRHTIPLYRQANHRS